MKIILALLLAQQAIAAPPKKTESIVQYSIPMADRTMTAYEGNADQIETIMKNSGKKVVTILGNGEIPYASWDVDGYRPDSVVDGFVNQLDPEKYILVFNDTRQLRHAVKMAELSGFQTVAILPSSQKEKAVEMAGDVGTVLFVKDSSEGGYVPGTTHLTPTSKAILGASDMIRAFGGDKKVGAEVLEAFKAGKDVRFTSLEQQRGATIKKASKQNRPPPKADDFKGHAYKTLSVAANAKLKHLGDSEEIGESNKTPGEKTFRIMEIWDYEPSPEVMKHILQKCSDPTSGLQLVTEEEIRAGKTKGGAAIGDNSLYLLEQGQTVHPNAVAKDASLRVSMASQVRIRVPDPKGGPDRYVLLANRASLAQGKPKLGPLGGALEATNDSQLSMLGITYEKKPQELRFKTAGSNLMAVKNWFDTRRGREVEPGRELYEELVEENKLVPAEVFEGEMFQVERRRELFSAPPPEFISCSSLMTKLDR